MASGHIYQYLSRKIIRVAGDTDDEKHATDGTRLILDKRVSNNIDERKFSFEPQKGYEPYGFIRHVKSRKLVRANNDKLEVHKEEDRIRKECLFAFDLEDGAIIHWGTKKVWDSNEDDKLKLVKREAVETKYFFGDEEGKVTSPYPAMVEDWKLLKTIVAPKHSGNISVSYTVGLTTMKTRQITGEVTASLELAMKIATATFGSTISVMQSKSSGTSKQHQETLTIEFGHKADHSTDGAIPGTGAGVANPGTGTGVANPGTGTGVPNPGTGTGVPNPGTGAGGANPGTRAGTSSTHSPVTCVWQYYRSIPNIGAELGFLSDIIVVTNDFEPPTATQISPDAIKSLLLHRM